MAEEPEQQDSPEAEGGEEPEKESGDEHEQDEEEEPKPEIVVGLPEHGWHQWHCTGCYRW